MQIQHSVGARILRNALRIIVAMQVLVLLSLRAGLGWPTGPIYAVGTVLLAVLLPPIGKLAWRVTPKALNQLKALSSDWGIIGPARWQLGMKGLLLAMTVSAILIGTIGVRYWHVIRRGAIAAKHADLGVFVNKRGQLSLRMSAGQVTDLKRLQVLLELQCLMLDDLRITHDGFVHLRGLKSLRVLTLRGSNVTDVDLEHLGGLKELRELYLGGCTSVSDAGMKHLTKLDTLQSVQLTLTSVSDEGLRELASLPKLKWVEVTGTRVTKAGAVRFQRVKPDCEVLN